MVKKLVRNKGVDFMGGERECNDVRVKGDYETEVLKWKGKCEGGGESVE